MALASYQRAVDVLEPLVAAAPDDKAREKALSAAKAELQKLKPAQAAEQEPAAQPVAAE